MRRTPVRVVILVLMWNDLDVGSLLLRILVLYVGISVVLMIAMSAIVFFTGGRRSRPSGPQEGPAPSPLDRGAQVYAFESVRQSRWPHGEAPDLHTASVFAPEDQGDPEPAIDHQVDSDSAAIERLLAGVSMPCGLERLPNPEAETDRLAFVTSGHDARVVAVSVVDELERLGLDVEPLSYTEARAWRDGFEVAVSLYLDPGRVIRDRRAAFPGAPKDSVVIEFSVV